MEQFYYANDSMNFGVCPYYQGSSSMNPTAMVNYYFTPNQGYRNLPDSWSLGPLKIEWSFDGQSINLIVKMFEEAVKDIVLSLAKPTLSFTTTFGDTSINLKINADFENNKVSITGAVCFDTVCTTFNNTVIATW